MLKLLQKRFDRLEKQFELSNTDLRKQANMCWKLARLEKIIALLTE